MWTWLRKGNLKRETEFLLIAAQNNAIRTNHIKARINKNTADVGYVVIDKAMKYIISECSKLVQKNIRQDMTGWRR